MRQMKILELKNTTKIRIVPSTAEQKKKREKKKKISDLEYRAMENTSSEQQKENELK